MESDARNHVVDVIGAYVLGALEDDETRAVEAHLLVCESCGDALRDALEVRALFGPGEGTPPGPEVWEKIQDGIRK